MLIDELLFACGEPGNVESQRREAADRDPIIWRGETRTGPVGKAPPPSAPFRASSALQAEHIGRQCVVENLPTAVVEHLVSKCPAAQYGIKMFAAHAFPQKACTRVDAQLVDLEFFHKGQFVSTKFAQAWNACAADTARKALCDYLNGYFQRSCQAPPGPQFPALLSKTARL